MKTILISFATLFVTSSLAQSVNYKGKKVKLGPEVNSSAYEGAPMISPDGSTLYFYRAGHTSNLGYAEYDADEDIWFAKVIDGAVVGSVKNIGKPLNGNNQSCVAGVSADGKQLFVYNTYRDQWSFDGLATTSLTKHGKWSKPTPITIKDFKFEGRFIWMHAPSNGVATLISMEGKDSKGKDDIYICLKNDKGGFDKMVNLSDINSAYTEISPFLAPDNKTLYFTSNRPGGYGNMDIYYSTRLDDTWLNWSKPENIGPSINTENWDSELSVDAKGEVAYFVSGGKSYGENADIYKIKLTKDQRPEKAVMITGGVIDAESKQAVSATIKAVNLETGEVVANVLSNPKDGAFSINLLRGESYQLVAEKEDYLSVVLDMNDVQEDDSVVLYLEPIAKGRAVNFNNINFERGKDELLEGSKLQLMELVKVLKEHSHMRIEVVGHTERRGSYQLNLELSESRADKVKAYLVSQGIARSRIKTQGKGSKEPIADNKTSAGRAKNRRVEIKILEL